MDDEFFGNQQDLEIEISHVRGVTDSRLLKLFLVSFSFALLFGWCMWRKEFPLLETNWDFRYVNWWVLIFHGPACLLLVRVLGSDKKWWHRPYEIFVYVAILYFFVGVEYFGDVSVALSTYLWAHLGLIVLYLFLSLSSYIKLMHLISLECSNLRMKKLAAEVEGGVDFSIV